SVSVKQQLSQHLPVTIGLPNTEEGLTHTTSSPMGAAQPYLVNLDLQQPTPKPGLTSAAPWWLPYLVNLDLQQPRLPLQPGLTCSFMRAALPGQPGPPAASWLQSSQLCIMDYLSSPDSCQLFQHGLS
ncbi:unnamed protein product, partial [Meganyctiphanes norvegica]